jgi:hypothetical protein
MASFGIGTTEFVIMGLLPDVASDLGVTIPQSGLLVPVVNRIEPISLSAYPFCHGERGDVGRSRMPIDRSLRMKTSP